MTAHTALVILAGDMDEAANLVISEGGKRGNYCASSNAAEQIRAFANKMRELAKVMEAKP